MITKKNVSFSINVLKRYLFFLFSQKWDRKTINAFQDRRLIDIVIHAGNNVPYYRNLFREIGFEPKQFRGRCDLHKIPLLNKETLRTHQDEFIAKNAEQYGINWDSTSGSTGTPLHLIIDDRTKAYELASVIRSYQWAGYFPGKKVFSIQSYNFVNNKVYSKHYPYINLWRFDSKKLDKDTALKMISDINRIKPHVIIGYPFSIFMLSKIAQEENLSIHSVESIVTAGETLSARRRELLENNFNCKIFDFYSLHELVALISECQHFTKHLCEDFAYAEVVDENGKDASDHGLGEIVGTGLFNYAMPLIRYKIGDTIRIDKGDNVCKCGRQFKIVKEIIGRQNDYIETPDGRFLGNVLEHSIDNSKGVVLSQCVQDAVDHIYLNLIIDERFNKNSKIAIEKGLRHRLGDEIKIDFKIVTELEKKEQRKNSIHDIQNRA